MTKEEEAKNVWDDCVTAIGEHSVCLHHEESLARNPFDVTAWSLYLDELDELLLDKQNNNNNNTTQRLRDFVGRRAVQHLPRSYKLWKRQWEFALKYYSSSSPENTRACFEQAVVTLSAFPRVWMVYLDFLLQDIIGKVDNDQQQSGVVSVTTVRRTINRALQALPVTQHQDKIWRPILLKALLQEQQQATMLPVPTRACLLQRYTYLQPTFLAEFGAWCEAQEQWGRAATAYQSILMKSGSDAEDDTTEIWQAFGNLCSQHSQQVESVGIRWEAILHTALEAASTTTTTTAGPGQTSAPQLLQGMIYSWLANAWVRRGAFDLARSVYEEGLGKVTSVRDFSLLYEAYLGLEEGLLEHAVASLEQQEEETATEQEPENDQDDWDILLGTTATSPLADMELAMARAEHLTRRRPLLLNQVMLRQNPNHIEEWLNRAELYLKQQQHGQAANALQQALKTVRHPNHGSMSELVVKLVAVYADDMQGVDRARTLLDSVCNPLERSVMSTADDLAACWATWIELELRQEKWDEALGLARQSVAPVGKKIRPKYLPNLTKSLRLWDLLLDLEESLGTIQTTKDAYNRALEVKAATVQHVLNFTSFLTEHNYFEESFAAYERGVELFAFPHAGAKLLWKDYLKAFVDRYKGTKVERTRDLFRRCLERCPAEECSEFYMMNGKFEEEYGLTKRALSVFREMCQKVPRKEKLTAYQLCIAKTTKYLGATASRDIYQDAIDVLDDQASSKICIEFAQMEAGLQEIERARAILTYGAQMADPRRFPEYWKHWNDFEIANGNEESFREMLRVKRSVEAAFSTVNYNASGMTEKVDTISQEEAMRMIASEEGVDVEETPKTAVAGFVSGKRTAPVANLQDVEQRAAKIRKATGAVEADAAAGDEEEIDIDDIDAEIEEAATEGAAAAVQGVVTKSVPDAVFGSLAYEAEATGSKGALERIRLASSTKTMDKS